MQKVDHDIGFYEKRNFLKKLVKITENYNIDP
jgi:hypothetical protein